MQSNFVFLTNDEKSGKVKLYFQVKESGDVLEVAWGNKDYIANKLSDFGVKDIDGLRAYLVKNPEQEVYMYHYKNKEGQEKEGFTLDKPFPVADKPEKAIVQGKIAEVRDNGLKVAVIVDTGKGKLFTVVRSYYVFNQDAKKSYPLEQKRQNLLSAFNVDDFGDLVGQTITFTRQAAGSNYYYEPAQD